MPTGATLVFSHGQSRENNSWASGTERRRGAAAATRGTKGRGGEGGGGEAGREAGRKGEISEAELCYGYSVAGIVINSC